MTPDDLQPLLHRVSFDSFIDSFPGAFVALDAQWRLQHVNRLAEHLLQTPAADMLGKDVWECLPDVVVAQPDEQLLVDDFSASELDDGLREED
jgi:PAS domain-containing protein